MSPGSDTAAGIAAGLAPEDATLAARCASVAEAAAEALGWIAENGAVVREAAPALARDFRRFGLAARKLAAAAQRPMCVSVFGPSQAGKSYLISALARKGTNPVTAVFGAETVDFVRRINPEGGKEATGLVTRFTMRPTPGLPGAPVTVRMLTQTDVVKILGNSFLEDFNRDSITPLAPEALAKHLSGLAARARSAPAKGLDEDLVYDLQEYFERYFRGHPVILTLGGAYWREAAELAPLLSVADRAELFAPLWNLLPAFTATARRLTEALECLGDPDEAFLPLAALLPREISVINVDTLDTLAAPDPGNPLPVTTRSGRTATLPRAVVTALIAELRLTLAELPWDFMASTDLLDFPGARSREVLSDPEGYLRDPAKLAPLYLRGKVAYLYQRYVADQELTAMLLCIGPSNQDVRTLPNMVREWVDATHGATAEERARQPTALFLVLTKFDAEFEEAQGKSDVGTGEGMNRWTARIQASITRYLALDHQWPLEWTPGRPFDNTFWLRNPNFINKGLLDYDAARREIGVREPDRVARLREEFVNTEAVKRHFADPARAWDEAMRLNDGGVSYLAERLAPVCNPALKRGQVAARLAALARTMAQRLDPFHVSDDREAERKKRRAEGAQAARAMAAAAAAQRFGLMLKAMMVEAEALEAAFRRLLLAAPEEAAKPAIVGAAVAEDALASELASLFGEDATPAPAARATDMADRLAEAALETWGERLAAFAADEATLGFLRLPRDAAVFIATQIEAGASTRGLREEIARRVRSLAGFHERLSDSLIRPVMVAERMINDHVAFLGFDRVPEAERPKVPRDGRAVFAAREAAEDIPALGPTPLPFEATFTVDWITAFAKLIDLNVDHAFGGQVNAEANARLGRILGTLRAAA
jgi:hypothetical protein